MGHRGNVKCVNLYQGIEKAQPAQQKDHIPIMTYTVLLVLTLMHTYNEIPKYRILLFVRGEKVSRFSQITL